MNIEELKMKIQELPLKEARRQWMNSFEQFYLMHLIRSVKYNAKQAAKKAGIVESRVYQLLDKHGINLRELRKGISNVD